MIPTALTVKEIDASVKRLEAAFNGYYASLPLKEGSRSVGCVRLEGNKLYLTFRGSVNSFSELLTCLDFRKVSADSKWGLPGKIHAGLYASFCKVQKSLDSQLQKLFPQKNLKGVQVLVEGYSRGSALAMLTAAYLTQCFAADHLTLLTYSPLNIFDKIAAKAHQKKIKNQVHFVCTGDFVPQWIGPPCLGFYPCWNRREFAPDTSPSFLERVQKKAYTHLIRPRLIGRILRWIIPLRLWEAHMPETYMDRPPFASLFRKS